MSYKGMSGEGDKYNSLVGKFTRGPLSNNQIIEFCKYGVNAIRIFLYIRMQEGKLVSKGYLKSKEHTFITLDNKNTEAMVGLHKSHKWDRLRTLEQKGLLSVNKIHLLLAKLKNKKKFKLEILDFFNEKEILFYQKKLKKIFLKNSRKHTMFYDDQDTLACKFLLQ